MNVTLNVKIRKAFTEKFSDRPNILFDILNTLDEVNLGEEIPESRYATLQDLLKHMSEALSIPIKKIVHRERYREQVAARQYLCYQIRNIFKNRYSYSDIGIYIGGYDHSTIIHNVQVAKDRLDTGDVLMSDIHNKWITYNS